MNYWNHKIYFIAPQPIKNNISNYIQINSEFAKTFSQDIEKDNFFRRHSIDIKNTYNSDDSNLNSNGKSENIKNQKENEEDKYNENPLINISAYDYNNFYFNRCLGIYFIYYSF